MIGSELVQKYVGEGARMVRELFEMARWGRFSPVLTDSTVQSGRRRPVSSSSMRLTQLVAPGLMMALVVTTRWEAFGYLIQRASLQRVFGRFKEPCWSWLTSWMVSTLVATSRWNLYFVILKTKPPCRCWWQPTDQTHLTLLSWDQEDSTGRCVTKLYIIPSIFRSIIHVVNLLH